MHTHIHIRKLMLMCLCLQVRTYVCIYVACMGNSCIDMHICTYISPCTHTDCTNFAMRDWGFLWNKERRAACVHI